MECPKCGVANREEAERCRRCGAQLRLMMSMHLPSKECPFCKKLNANDATFCVNCNRHLGGTSKKTLIEEEKKAREERYYDRTYADYATSAKSTARLGLAGTIMLMVGLFIFLDVAFSLGIGYQVTQMDVYDELVQENPRYKSFFPNLAVCESLRIVFGCITFVGAFAAIRRLNFGLALMGCVFGILALGSSILALVWWIWLLITGLLFFAVIIALGMV